ncbi:DUF6338 family protein [Streptomyces ficellus]|uniref:Uncharacterized protein n=1 Tax=Streptomyces ficellus TaxID=1977088 RepID=A0A1W5T296_9ACTN|nr:DUF6338 family protein [Streptomyces ficellus]ARF06195.1 hypothetical protein [Streptomyces ficellus]QGV77850.1 hypothetical protein EIZ62_06005 [Streptomyces ficellus]
MPTTFTGLILLVVLLLPGLTFVVRERQGSERRPTPFRETGTVVFCSVLTELLTLALFAAARGLMPGLTPDVGRLVREGGGYARDQYVQLGWWAGALLLFSCALAAAAAAVTGKRPHASVMSAWWVMFDRWYPGEDPLVGCVLEDGSYIEGRQASFNVSSDDSPDRDLVLVEPLKYRAPGATEVEHFPWGAACVSARRIVTMFVSYPDPEQEAGAAATQGSAPAAS